jgi:hypothetical protein
MLSLDKINREVLPPDSAICKKEILIKKKPVSETNTVTE